MLKCSIYFFGYLQETKFPFYQGTLTNPIDIAYRIVSDHSRMITVSLSDGLKPSGQDAGRHWRKVFRKAYWHLANDFNHQSPRKVMSKLASQVNFSLGDFYPEISENMPQTLATIETESEIFEKILEKSQIKFKHLSSRLKASQRIIITGEEAFDLFLGNGTPQILIQLLANKYNLSIDWKGFDECFFEHKKKSAIGLFKKLSKVM